MKSGIYKVFAIITTILFVLVAVKVAYDFYSFEGKIVKDLGVIDIKAKKVMVKAITEIAIFAGVAFFLALLAILLTNIHKSGVQLLEDTAAYKVVEDNIKPEVQQTRENLGAYSSLDDINRVFAGYKDRERLEKLLGLVCNALEACQGVIYTLQYENTKKYFAFEVGYAFYVSESKTLRYEVGEGLVGQVAKDANFIVLQSVPDGYMQVVSGLGQSSPESLMIIPVFSKNQKDVVAIFEIAAFKNFTEAQIKFVQEVASLLSVKMEEPKSDYQENTL
ncbi:MAG: GAF domain-containing protein [Thermonemataceae bacterium]|nr:GAF domain-containing protein [Thermonemataceae bacterium]